MHLIFLPFNGEVIATQQASSYVVQDQPLWILFPNPEVKRGLGQA